MINDPSFQLPTGIVHNRLRRLPGARTRKVPGTLQNRAVVVLAKRFPAFSQGSKIFSTEHHYYYYCYYAQYKYTCTAYTRDLGRSLMVDRVPGPLNGDHSGNPPPPPAPARGRKIRRGKVGQHQQITTGPLSASSQQKKMVSGRRLHESHS